MNESDTSSVTCEPKRPRVPRPPNAFMIFGKDRRRLLAQQYSNLSNKEVSKVLGEEWRVMDKEAKDRYLRLADEAQRLHKVKYPGYYYSPLEARQRKAQRKSKSKMSANSLQTETIAADWQPITEPCLRPPITTRPFMFPNPMTQMPRPVFAPPFGPRFGPFIPYPFGSVLIYPSNGSYQQTEDQSSQMLIHPKSEDNWPEEYDTIEEPNRSDAKSEVKTRTEQTTQSDIEVLSDYLPPMHNPSAAVTRVRASEDLLMNQNSRSKDVTKMANAEVLDEYVLPDTDADQRSQ